MAAHPQSSAAALATGAATLAWEQAAEITAAAILAAPEQAVPITVAILCAIQPEYVEEVTTEIVDAAIEVAPALEDTIMTAFHDLGIPLSIPDPPASEELNIFTEFQAINRGTLTTTPQSVTFGAGSGLPPPGATGGVTNNRPQQILIPLEVVEP